MQSKAKPLPLRLLLRCGPFFSLLSSSLNLYTLVFGVRKTVFKKWGFVFVLWAPLFFVFLVYTLLFLWPSSTTPATLYTTTTTNRTSLGSSLVRIPFVPSSSSSVLLFPPLEELYTLPPTAPTFWGLFKGGEEEKNVEFLIPLLLVHTHTHTQWCWWRWNAVASSSSSFPFPLCVVLLPFFQASNLTRSNPKSWFHFLFCSCCCCCCWHATMTKCVTSRRRHGSCGPRNESSILNQKNKRYFVVVR